MILAYEAIDTDGRATSDTVDAPNTMEAVEQLRRKGLFVTQITAASARTTGQRAHGGTTAKRMPLKTLYMFTRQMSMMLRAGSAVVPAVAAVQRQTQKPGHAALLGQIVDDLEEGSTFTNALRKHPRTFDPIYCAIVAAGEASAKLPEMFVRLSDIVGKRRAIRNQIVGALSYPVVLIAMSTQILSALMFFVIPRFGDMFAQLDVEPPMATKMLLATASALRSYWPFLLTFVVAATVAAIFTLSRPRGRQWMTDTQTRVPVVGRLISWLIQAQIFRTMGMLLENGVSVLDTLELTRESTRNARFQKLFDRLEAAVTSGGSFSTAFEESKAIEPYICQAIHTGEDSGNIGGAMTFCADMLDESNQELINVTMRLIEPIILVGMGLVVGGVAVSLFLPLFDMTAAMN